MKRERSAYGHGNDGFAHDQWIVVEHWFVRPGDVMGGCIRREAGPYQSEGDALNRVAINEAEFPHAVHSSRVFKRRVKYSPWEATS